MSKLQTIQNHQKYRFVFIQDFFPGELVRKVNEFLKSAEEQHYKPISVKTHYSRKESIWTADILFEHI